MKRIILMLIAGCVLLSIGGALAIQGYYAQVTRNDEQARADTQRVRSIEEANAVPSPPTLHDPAERSCTDVYNAIQRGMSEEGLTSLIGAAGNRSLGPAYGETGNGGFALYACRDGEIYVEFTRDDSHIETGQVGYLVSYFSMQVTRQVSGYAPY